MKTRDILVIMGHKEVEATILRHTPYWVKLGIPMIGVSPNDGTQWPYEIYESVRFGASQLFGWEMAKRSLELFRYLGNRQWQWPVRYIVIDYDQLVFGPIAETNPNRFYCEHAVERPSPFPSQFSSLSYCVVPYVLGPTLARKVVRRMTQQFKRGRYEWGFQDRILGICNLSPRLMPGCITTAFDRADESFTDTVARGVADGKVNFVHMIKTEAQLNAVTKYL